MPASTEASAPCPVLAPVPSAVQDVKVPDIGDFEGIPVIDIHVKTGDIVEKDQLLITLESDKATMDVPSPAAGTVREIKIKSSATTSRKALSS